MTVGENAAAWISGRLFAVEHTPPPPMASPDMTGWLWILVLAWMVWAATSVGWVWMLIHCYRHEPDREFWFWVMLLIPPAALVYFFARWLPGRGGSSAAMPKGFKRWSRKREIEQLEIAARQIGNPHQWVLLGDALRDVGRFQEAAEAYDKALAKEADNIQALWGAGAALLELEQFAAAEGHLEKALAIRPDYKFGDLSLAYGKALCAQGDIDKAANHLERHVSRWRHSEALYLLATLEIERGNPEQARGHLQGLLLDINGSPTAIARKHSRWKSRATKLLRQIPR